MSMERVGHVWRVRPGQAEEPADPDTGWPERLPEVWSL
jgi:hypothetical protein